jgi:hypothetical protein
MELAQAPPSPALVPPKIASSPKDCSWGARERPHSCYCSYLSADKERTKKREMNERKSTVRATFATTMTASPIDLAQQALALLDQLESAVAHVLSPPEAEQDVSSAGVVQRCFARDLKRSGRRLCQELGGGCRQA